MPTMKQRVATEKMVENGGNVSQAMVEAGYSPSTAHTPGKLTESKGFTTILEELQHELGAVKVGPKKLARVIKQGLAAKQPGKVIVIEKGDDGDVVSRKTIDMPDHNARHKYLDTSLKILGGYPKEDKSPTNLILAQFKAMANEYMVPTPTQPMIPDSQDYAADIPEAEVLDAS